MKKKKPQQQVKESMELENETVQDFTGNIGIGDVPSTPLVDTRADSGQTMDYVDAEHTIQNMLQPKEGKVVPSIFNELTPDELLQLLSGEPSLGVYPLTADQTSIMLKRDMPDKLGKMFHYSCSVPVPHPITYQKVFRALIYLGENVFKFKVQ